mgnify:CR=1 FL=1
MENVKHTQPQLETELKDLFLDGKTVSALRITHYLAWAAQPEQYSHVLAIPPIQRGFVWKPKQIQDLWDSLLRDMPIGSVLLKASSGGEKSRQVTSEKTNVQGNPKSGFHLMDGQQRTLSMLLGFPDSVEAQHKLWVDFSVPGKNGSQFQFRVTTAVQPFGYNADGGRLLLQERRDAREIWNGDNPTETKQKKTNQDIFKDETTRPWKAGGKQQEYIFEVKKLWQWLDKHGTSVSEWTDEITRNKKDGLDETTLGRIKKFGNALNKLQNQWIALIKIPDVEVQSDIEDPSHDYLTMLFDRISSNGTRLRPDDLLFSMIKQSWPEAHNIVYDLQEQVGSLMKPTDFVMTAFRLAMLLSNDTKKHDPELNAMTFHKHLGGLLGTDGNLREMIGERGSLINAFNALIKLIKYRDIKYRDDSDDRGIPRAMFPYMNESMLQVILYWMIRNPEHTDSFEASRDEVLRFILFWFVCNKDAASAYKASKTAIDLISANKGDFPGKKIYQELARKDADGKSSFFPLIEPSSKEINTNQLLHTQEQRAEYYFGTTFLYANFTTRKGLLLWLQRKWVENEFKDFNPMAGQDEDNVPYDFDHLVPQSNWSSLGGIDRNGITQQESRKIFEDLYHRRALGNSIGNYRVMNGSVNKGRKDKPLGDELNELVELKPKKIYESNYAFNTDEIEIQKWILASPPLITDGNGGVINTGFIWDNNRLHGFQYAVESRVLYLYKRYFDDAKFKYWLQAE